MAEVEGADPKGGGREEAVGVKKRRRHTKEKEGGGVSLRIAVEQDENKQPRWDEQEPDSLRQANEKNMIGFKDGPISAVTALSWILIEMSWIAGLS